MGSDDGFMYIGIGTSKANIAAYRISTGEHREILPLEFQSVGQANVYRGQDGNIYGAVADHHFRLKNWTATPIGDKEASPALLPDRLHDGRMVEIQDRMLRLRNSKTGEHLDSKDLRPLGYSGSKARAIIEVARAIVEGRLDLEGLVQLDNRQCVERLVAIRGVGRWTAEYLLLRGLGRTTVFPGDDVGARNNLERWLRLRNRLDYERVQKVLHKWKGYGGLIFLHLLLKSLDDAGSLGLPRLLSQPIKGRSV